MSKGRTAKRFHCHLHLAFAVALFCPANSTLAQTANCERGPQAAAAANAASLWALQWSPFGRAETGWAIYEPLIANDIGSACPAASPGFAAALARWQAANALVPTGVLDPATFPRLRVLWQSRRPFVQTSRRACPASPDEASLATAAPAESYGGKRVLLRPGALNAYRRMIAAARAQHIAAAGGLLTIFSGYRSPSSDAARCVREGNCQGVTRATCSAHRTGLAMDLFLGSAPGHPPDSSDDVNRLAISRSPAYRWLVRNGRRFGFVNYPFEPWHWEWTGEPP
jgi:hypothetical protein